MSTSKENVANMLPIVGLDNTTTKDVSADVEDIVKDVETEIQDEESKLALTESIIDYINLKRDYDYEVSESVDSVVMNYKTDGDISRKTRKLIIKRALLVARFKAGKKDKCDKKILFNLKNEIKLLDNQLDKITSTSDKALLKEIKKLQSIAKKEAIKEIKSECKENDDVKTESVEESLVEEVVIETTKEDDDDDKKVPPELKRIDIKRAKLEELKNSLSEALDKLSETGEKMYENKVKGLTNKIEKLEEEIKKEEEKVDKLQKESAFTESVVLEAREMEDEIKPIVEKLEAKGYKVKYASPGHRNLRKKEDKEPDGVYYDHLYSDARIMFEDNYNLSEAPEYWHFREVDGCTYLDISPLKYNEKKDGSPDKAFEKWKTNYMNSLKKYVDELPNRSEKEVKESFNDMVDSIFESMDYDFDDEEITMESVGDTINARDSILDELDRLLND